MHHDTQHSNEAILAFKGASSSVDLVHDSPSATFRRYHSNDS